MSNVTPAPLRQFPAGRRAIAGVAWAQTRGIGRVEVSIDGGPFADAELAAELSADTWRQWRLPWTATPGNHRIVARATDGDGVRQTENRSPVLPDGASGWQKFWHMTIPLLMPSITMALILRAIDAFRIFDITMVLAGQAIPVMSSFVYQDYRAGNTNTASAAAVILLLMIVVFVIAYIFLVERCVEGEDR